MNMEKRLLRLTALGVSTLLLLLLFAVMALAQEGEGDWHQNEDEVAVEYRLGDGWEDANGNVNATGDDLHVDNPSDSNQVAGLVFKRIDSSTVISKGALAISSNLVLHGVELKTPTKLKIELSRNSEIISSTNKIRSWVSIGHLIKDLTPEMVNDGTLRIPLGGLLESLGYSERIYGFSLRLSIIDAQQGEAKPGNLQFKSVEGGQPANVDFKWGYIINPDPTNPNNPQIGRLYLPIAISQ